MGTNFSKDPSLESVRREIDNLDYRLMELIKQRFELVDRAMEFKSTSEDVIAEERFQEMLKARRIWATALQVDEQLIEQLFTLLVHAARARQMELLAGRDRLP